MELVHLVNHLKSTTCYNGLSVAFIAKLLLSNIKILLLQPIRGGLRHNLRHINHFLLLHGLTFVDWISLNLTSRLFTNLLLCLHEEIIWHRFIDQILEYLVKMLLSRSATVLDDC